MKVVGFINYTILESQLSGNPESDCYDNLIPEDYYFLELRDDESTVMLKTRKLQLVNRILMELQPGDVLITSRLLNFAESYGGLIATMKKFIERGIRVLAIHEGFDSQIHGEAVLMLVEPLQRYDRDRTENRMKKQKKGIQQAKKEGRYTGKKAYTPDKYENFSDLYQEYQNRSINKGEFAASLGVSRPTLEKLIHQYKARE